MQAFDYDISLLPPQHKILLRVFDMPTLLKVLELRGGTFVQWPTGRGHSVLWRKTLGEEAFNSLVNSELAGTTMCLPKNDKLLSQIRNAYIKSQRGHKSLTELALELNLTVRWISHIWNEDDDTNTDQLDLLE